MTNMTAPTLEALVHERVFTPLARLRHRARLYLLIAGLGRLFVALILGGLVQLCVDRWFRLTVDQRVVLNVALTLVWSWIVLRRIILPLVRPVPDRLLARLVDRANPELSDHLTAAVELVGGQRLSVSVADGRAHMPRGASPELIRAVVQDACEAVAHLPFLRILNHRAARWHIVQVFALLLVAVAAFAAMPETMGTWFARNWFLQDLAWPQRTYIWPDGFGIERHRRMARGDNVEISATVRGAVPDNAVLEWHTPDGLRVRTPMAVVGEARLVAALGPLAENITFRITGNDERTHEFTLEAVEPPRVIHTRATITPPTYTELPPLEFDQQTVLEILAGSTLSLTAQLNKPVRIARLVDNDGVAAPCTIAPDDATATPTLSIDWPAPRSGTYRFELEDLDGINSRNPVRYTLKLVADQPPVVRAEFAGVGDFVTPTAEVPVSITCEDAYGLTDVAVRIQAGERPERRVVPQDFTSGRRTFAATFVLGVGGSEVQPGETLRVLLEATDGDPNGPNIGTTPDTTLRVVSPEDFLIEMGRRELLLRQEFERLVSAQRATRDALLRIVETLPLDQPASPADAQRLGALARQQERLGGRCRTMGRAFAQILTEMRISRVARQPDERRLTDEIADPLESLAREQIPAAAERISSLSTGLPGVTADEAVNASNAILSQMEAILARMMEWEGYREAVALLQEVIDSQSAVQDDTRAALERQLGEILDLDDLFEEDGQ